LLGGQDAVQEGYWVDAAIIAICEVRDLIAVAVDYKVPGSIIEPVYPIPLGERLSLGDLRKHPKLEMKM
jgi:hypothetical protein